MNTYKRTIAQLLSKQTGLDEAQILKGISTPPPNVAGDFSVPCFPFAKTFRKAPKLIAEELAASLSVPDKFSNILAVNGYLNFVLDHKQQAEDLLTSIYNQKDEFGRNQMGEGKTVTIDFSSPNMGKELAFHHLRGTMLGNALSRVYDYSGYRVIRINHLGDWGTSYGKLIVMVLKSGLPTDETSLKNMSIEKLNELYKAFALAAKDDEGLEDEARAAFQQLESGNDLYQRMWAAFRETTLTELQRLYSVLDVSFDEYKGEAFFVGHAPALLQLLKDKGLAVASEGSLIVKLDAFDMPPLMLQKSDGSTLYATRDLAAARYRKENYDFHKNLEVVDNGQSLHFRQFFKVLELMGHTWHTKCEHIAFGLILTKGASGKWERGKTRAGGVSLLKDVIDNAAKKIEAIIDEKNPELEDKRLTARKISVGALVFNDLKHRRLNDVNFDWDSVLSFEGDTGPYVVNAYVRLCSIIRKYQKSVGATGYPEFHPGKVAFDQLSEPESRTLISSLAEFPEKVQSVITKNEPYILGQYALTVAEKAHGFIHACRVIGSDEQWPRLFLVHCTRQVLKNTLGLLGVPIVEAM